MRPATRAAAWGGALAVAAIVVSVDQVAKAAVVAGIDRGERVEILPILDLVHVLNRGVAFGFLGDGSKGLVIAITVAALAAVIAWFAYDPRRPWAWLAVGMLVGGALGNLADRVRQDAVIDFIDFPAWPSFNFADIFISVGAAVLVLAAVSGVARDEGESAKPAAPPSDAGGG
ncbi:MAG TPA: signal peptidase II [Solirubrobacterales bacterium]